MRRRLSRATEETFRSLHVRNFRLFFLGQSVSQIGNWLTLVAQTLLVLRLTGSGVAVGLLTACQFAPVLVLGAWAGLVADRSDKRRMLIIVLTGSMVQSFTLAGLAFTDDPPLLAFYAVALAGGFFTAFDNPTRRSLVAEMVPATHVQNAVSLNSALMMGSRIIGPALAGLLIHTVGYGWCFLLDGLSYLAVIGGLWRMDTSQLRPGPVAARARGQIRAGLRYVRSVPDLWVSLVMMAVIGSLAFNYQVVFPLFATRSLGGGDGAFTLLYSVVSIGSLIGALGTARATSVSLRKVTGAAAALGGSMLALAAMPNLASALPVAVLLGVTSIAFMTSSTAIVQLRADPGMRGRVLALQTIVFLGSTPIGGPVLGVICEAFGARFGLVVGGAACFVAAAWGLRAAKRFQPAVPAEDTVTDLVLLGAQR